MAPECHNPEYSNIDSAAVETSNLIYLTMFNFFKFNSYWILDDRIYTLCLWKYTIEECILRLFLCPQNGTDSSHYFPFNEYHEDKIQFHDYGRLNKNPSAELVSALKC